MKQRNKLLTHAIMWIISIITVLVIDTIYDNVSYDFTYEILENKKKFKMNQCLPGSNGKEKKMTTKSTRNL